MTEQEEDVAVKMEELSLAQVTLAYWRDRLATTRKLSLSSAATEDQLLEDLLNVKRSASNVRIAEIRLQAAKSRLRIDK